MTTALTLLKEQIKSSRELFSGTIAHLTDDMVKHIPGGLALPIGAVYAHLILSEDMAIATFLMGEKPLYETSWREKTGISLPMPAMDASWSENHRIWANTVVIDLQKLTAYATAVHAQTDAYVATLTDADIEREIDLGAWGKQTAAQLISGWVIGHSLSLAGEISALKGVAGSVGYPF
jgi:hypothetical protein